MFTGARKRRERNVLIKSWLWSQNQTLKYIFYNICPLNSSSLFKMYEIWILVCHAKCVFCSLGLARIMREVTLPVFNELRSIDFYFCKNTSRMQCVHCAYYRGKIFKLSFSLELFQKLRSAWSYSRSWVSIRLYSRTKYLSSFSWPFQRNVYKGSAWKGPQSP